MQSLRVAGLGACVTAVLKGLPTNDITFLNLREVLGVLNLESVVRMSGATGTQAPSESILCAEDGDDFSPHRNCLQCFRITNDVESVASAAASNIDPILSLEESDPALRIASNSCEDHNLGFFSLEIVDTSKA